METRTDVRADELIIDDTRSVNSPPSYYYGKGSKVISEFKNCSTVGLPSDETYCTVVTVCPWTDDSGGAITQTAYIGDKVHIRKSTSDSEWGYWAPVFAFTPKEIYSYTPDNGWTTIEAGSSTFPPRQDAPYKGGFYLLALKWGSNIGRPVLVSGDFSGWGTGDTNETDSLFFCSDGSHRVFCIYNNLTSSIMGQGFYFDREGNVGSINAEERERTTIYYKKVGL